MKVNLNVSNSHSQGPQKGLADRKSHPCCSQSSPWKKEGWDNRLGKPFSVPPWPHSRDGDMSMRPGQRLESWLGIACLDTRPRVLGLMNNVCFQSDGLLLPPVSQARSHRWWLILQLQQSSKTAPWLAHQMSFVITFGNEGFTQGPNKRLAKWNACRIRIKDARLTT